MKNTNATLDIITKLWLASKSELLSFIKKRVQDEYAAEDILQDVYLKLHLSIEKIKNLQNIKAWIYQVARNTISDYFRAKYKYTKSIEPFDLKMISVKKDESYKLNGVINSLPEKYKKPLVLADIKGLPQKEIAEMIGLSLSATKSRIQRARKLLIKAMMEHCIFRVDKFGNIIECQNRNGEICFDPDFE